jgi:hypothetical protein
MQKRVGFFCGMGARQFQIDHDHYGLGVEGDLLGLSAQDNLHVLEGGTQGQSLSHHLSSLSVAVGDLQEMHLPLMWQIELKDQGEKNFAALMMVRLDQHALEGVVS